MDDLIRLNKAISQTGYCSRREADKLIEADEVLVNDYPVKQGQKILASDSIKVRTKLITTKKKERVYLRFKKPVGVTSTTDKKDNTKSCCHSA